MTLLCVCLNPAIDVTYRLEAAITRGSSHRVASVSERAGGKGVNVARVLQQLGAEVTLLAFTGGANGLRLRTELQYAGIDATFVDVAQPTRRTLVIADPEQATAFNEPGPALTADDWLALTGRFRDLLGDADLVVLSGSLPPGLLPDSYAVLTGLARDRGIPVILDADGPAFDLALPAAPSLVKPNLIELESSAGQAFPPVAVRSAAGREWIVTAGRQMLARGAGGVIVSLGPDGLIAISPDGEWYAVSPVVLDGNPTGAGDALVAALALGTSTAQPWPQLLQHAVATSAAAVARPLAGQIDPAVRARLLPEIVVERLS